MPGQEARGSMSNVRPPAVEHDGWPLHAIGRRASGKIPYMLPRQPGEIDRLDVQHYAFRAALRGNYVAPLTAPARVLDVGSGTGQWCYDLCEEFPEALVIGFDVEPGKPDWPANYGFVRGNVLDGVPFADDSFDYVHQRWMRVSIPVADWPAVVGNLVRVARPGGFVELAEFRHLLEPAGPATARVFELLHELAAQRALDGTGVVARSLTSYLGEAGATDVRADVVAVPVGEWGGTIGSMMASDLRSMITGLRGPFAWALGVPPDECDDLLSAALVECESHHTNTLCAFAHGRKPERQP
jgi:SAM-dependent methyltransferase